MLNQEISGCFFVYAREDLYLCTQKKNMTKEEFILKAVLAQMSSVLLVHDSEGLDKVIIANAMSMANELDKEFLFEKESTHEILTDIRNQLTDET